MEEDMTYCALVGLNETIDDPSGLIRYPKDSLEVERLDIYTLHWTRDNSAVKYLMGYDNDAEKITKEQAEKIEAAWREEQYGSDN